MEAMLSLPKALLDLAVSLFNIKNDDRTRQRLADLLGNVADCVQTIGDNIYNGVHDISACAELDAYIDHLHELVAEEIDEKTADQLTFWLKHVSEVPGYAAENIGIRIHSAAKPKMGSITFCVESLQFTAQGPASHRAVLAGV